MKREIDIKQIKNIFENFCQCKLPYIQIKYSENETCTETGEGEIYSLNININGSAEDELFHEFMLINDHFNLPEISLPIYREFRATTAEFEYLVDFKRFKSINSIKKNSKVTSYYVDKLKRIKMELSSQYRKISFENSQIADYLLYLKLLYRYIACFKILEPENDLDDILVKDTIDDSFKPLYNELLSMYINMPEDKETLDEINRKEKELILCLAQVYDK